MNAPGPDRLKLAPQAELTVRRAGDADAAAWTRYVDAHPQATVFHAWAWQGILRECFSHEPHYLIAERDGVTVGILPLACVRSLLFGRALISLPFCSYAGALADDDSVRRRLDDAARELAGTLALDHLELRLTQPSGENRPTQDLYVVFRKPIGGDHDSNLNSIPRKQRAMIRKGVKNGLISHLETPESFFPLYSDNTHRHGSPGCSIRFFQALADAFQQNCEFLIVRDSQGNAISGVLSLFHRDEVFPFYAGDTVAARQLAGNDFKYWEVMRRGAERGARMFNFGRSKRGTGSYDFKHNWGFEAQPLAYEYTLLKSDGIPQNNPLNPKYRLMINAWRRMPRWAVEFLGPRLVRGLG